MDLKSRIQELKAQRQAVILAHNYTLPEVQDIADYVGDSLGLSIQAKAAKAPVIVFAGVRFMAETAKILSPESTVLLPEASAGCPMAQMVTAEQVRQCRAEHPDALLVAYVNTTAETKSLIDICCTSANAEALIRSIPADREVVFLPDQNLGANVRAATGREMLLWQGFCPIHHAITPEEIDSARAAHPGAAVIVHPECPPEVVAKADTALSTGGMLKYVRESPAEEFIVGTVHWLIHRLQQENPGKRFYPLSPVPSCLDMEKITLEKILTSLETLSPAIELPAPLIERARQPIERMLALGQ